MQKESKDMGIEAYALFDIIHIVFFLAKNFGLFGHFEVDN